ncbi:hypothetical protein ACH5RR_023065 [Cinchona calisaya]|uniref:GATA-type domain-containing protein n=1 Tax=Cinchona calisaya TaxID=153742 RepID=A0ABD2Z9N2_9GENT
MSENAINCFGLMGREGPCFHCGVEHTPLWRSGPPEKPVLCNACGSRWRTRGTLEDYIPKRANKDIQNNPSNKSPSKLNEQAPMFESNHNFVGHDHQSPTILGDGTSNATSSAIGATISNNFSTQMQNMEAEAAVQLPVWVNNNVSKKKRSTLDQRIISPTERLHQQLCHALEDPKATKESNDDEDVLIFERINHYIPENEIGLGCMLLKSPASPTKISSSSKSPPDLLKSPGSPSKHSKRGP